MANMANMNPAPPWTHQLRHHPWRAPYSAAPNSCDRTGADKPERASSPSAQTACTLRSDGRNVPLPGRERNQRYSESTPALPVHFTPSAGSCITVLVTIVSGELPARTGSWAAGVLGCSTTPTFGPSHEPLISRNTTVTNSSCFQSSATQNAPFTFLVLTLTLFDKWGNT